MHPMSTRDLWLGHTCTKIRTSTLVAELLRKCGVCLSCLYTYIHMNPWHRGWEIQRWAWTKHSNKNTDNNNSSNNHVIILSVIPLQLTHPIPRPHLLMSLLHSSKAHNRNQTHRSRTRVPVPFALSVPKPALFRSCSSCSCYSTPARMSIGADVPPLQPPVPQPQPPASRIPCTLHIHIPPPLLPPLLFVLVGSCVLFGVVYVIVCLVLHHQCGARVSFENCHTPFIWSACHVSLVHSQSQSLVLSTSERRHAAKHVPCSLLLLYF